MTDDTRPSTPTAAANAAAAPATPPTRAWTGRVFIATSVDGYIARLDGDIDWLTDPPSHIAHPAALHSDGTPDYDAFLAGIDHIVMGRGTYEKVLTFDAWPYPEHPVIVLSSTLDPSTDSRVTVVATLDDAMRALDAAGAGGVYVDGGRVVQTFLRAGLIDELTITRAPVLLGEGLPLFDSMPTSRRLSLIGTSASPGGLTQATYRLA
ncbi:dihydrofolate reductase family protein [Plantibacter sp. Mn2098]|uniref:dihydrofolate reductase family protein n=1 Tax=Plantibacter sp. Mn2098 TaxID=3395266 RepID=UPI003BBC09D5